MNSEALLFIDDASALADHCQRLGSADWLAVDTEFVRDSTYYPQFCLLQLADQHSTACIDVLAIDDLSPLLELLFNPRCLKVFHAATQDLEIFYHLCKRLPTPVFDTQLAAPLLGYPEQTGYAALVNEYLGKQLGKGHQRTDWAKRPLSSAQLSYAADDVRYLAQLYPRMRDELIRLGRLDWLDEDFKQLVQLERYEQPIDDAWRRLKATKKLKGPRLRAAQRLAAWRERTAREENRPRSWILRDDALLDIAALLPADRNALSHLRSLKGRSGERYYDALLHEVELARSEPPLLTAEDRPLQAAPVETAQVDLLMALVQLRAQEHQVCASVLASRKALEQALRGDGDSPVFHGWRGQLIGDDIQRLINGRLALSIRDRRIAVNDV